MVDRLTIVVVGGGAAGFFGAIACAEKYPEHRVLLLEKTGQLLVKVKISGGGRCNVTHSCFDPSQLIKRYPRGEKELRGPFSYFQPRDTIQWFENRGVSLKTEEDGRMFPETDQSETIITCLLAAAKSAGVEILLHHGVQEISKKEEKFAIKLSNGEAIECDRILVATGSYPKMYPILETLGHSTVPLVPSLFTFNIPKSPFLDLAGISLPSVSVQLSAWGFQESGPILLTHWGLSGPAILKLSAWAARELHEANYHTPVLINWLSQISEEELRKELQQTKQACAAKAVGNTPLFSIPKQLWKRLITLSEIAEELRFNSLSAKQMQSLVQMLHAMTLQVEGKTTYKSEFVTCGGVALEEVNFKTMESRIVPGLYFAGEVLNIDGVTGGFNFQNAWTTGWIAGNAIGNQRPKPALSTC